MLEDDNLAIKSLGGGTQKIEDSRWMELGKRHQAWRNRQKSPARYCAGTPRVAKETQEPELLSHISTSCHHYLRKHAMH